MNAIFALLLLVAGIALVGRSPAGSATDVAAPAAATQSTEATPLPATHVPAATPTDSAAPSPTTAPTSAPLGRSIDGARITITRLGIDLPLAWGDVARDVPRPKFAGATPENVALVFPGSALPGAGGNTYIYSHARTGMFLSLWQARTGDVVLLRWPDGTRRYTISRIVPRVDPADVSWLDPSGPERLTLQTSTGPHPDDPRFVAVATPLALD